MGVLGERIKSPIWIRFKCGRSLSSGPQLCYPFWETESLGGEQVRLAGGFCALLEWDCCGIPPHPPPAPGRHLTTPLKKATLRSGLEDVGCRADAALLGQNWLGSLWPTVRPPQLSETWAGTRKWSRLMGVGGGTPPLAPPDESGRMLGWPIPNQSGENPISPGPIILSLHVLCTSSHTKPLALAYRLLHRP